MEGASEAVRRQLLESAELVPAEIRDDWERYLARTVFDVWERPVLEPRTRSLVTVAALATKCGSPIELRRQIRIALTNGLSRLELCEVMLSVGGYGGLAAGFEGLVALREVFDAEPELGTDPGPLPEGFPGDDRFERGRATFSEVVPRHAEAMHTRIKPYDEAIPSAEREPLSPFTSSWSSWIHATAYGDLWARPNLSLADRSRVITTVIIVLGRNRELQSHLEATVVLGISPAETAEHLLQLAVYIGFPSAVEAMLQFQEVLKGLESERAGNG